MKLVNTQKRCSCRARVATTAVAEKGSDVKKSAFAFGHVLQSSRWFVFDLGWAKWAKLIS